VTAEGKFHQAMVQLHATTVRELDYKPTYFVRMVSEHGGVEAARRLLATDKPSDGFTTLWEAGRLDLSVEAHVLDPAYEPLFTDDERSVAQRRLEQYGYPG
jgi:hypothetical protein